MNQQTSIICKQNIYIKQIYYFTDSNTLKELSNDFGVKMVSPLI